ncbi:DUF3152 domain-containing protein [Streptomyces sp. NPDC004542]|uniref:DUF3152 domain-containing protein n=1 Tax=Streptomyces sp. NPDC004542 TaxID=3154281 RepID=UPI0033A87D87
MGRHSRRGKAPKGDPASAATTAQTSGGSPTGQGTAPDRREPGAAPGTMPGARPEAGPVPVPGQRRAPMDGGAGHGVPRGPAGTSAQATPARNVPRTPDGTPAHGVPRMQDGTPARGMPRMQNGAQARDVPRTQDGTPAGGVPRPFTGTPARARGGHPEQREPGGGWGEFPGRGEGGSDVRSGAAGPRAGLPRQRQGVPGGPRKEYVDAFDRGLEEDDDVFAPRPGAGTRRTESRVPAPTRTPETGGRDDGAPPAGDPALSKGSKGRTFTGVAAAAVTTVLAVIVAGQVTDGRDDTTAQSRSAPDGSDAGDSVSRGDARPAPSGSPAVATLTYAQKMAATYPLGVTLKGPGKFDAVPGTDKAPGKGRTYTYRVDVERGLGLDGELFAQAVQKTLNDDRSWAHGGARTFERVSSGKPDFVITLASPGTTAAWCAKSGLDTTEDNVSCDSAATERVMINAYRWAQGSKTYGDEMHAYRQMLINHEVGHRLGYGHVTCDKNGQLAPVMQQQTKFLNHDGIHCLPNPWPYPRS